MLCDYYIQFNKLFHSNRTGQDRRTRTEDEEEERRQPRMKDFRWNASAAVSDCSSKPRKTDGK
eukprot:gene3526-4027_t